MKKILIILMIGCFTTSAISDELIMKCRNGYLYKHITQSTGDQVFSSHIKRDKGAYHKWCASEIRQDNKKFTLSIEGVELIVKDFKAICMVEKYTMKNGFVGRSQTSVIDFKKLNRKTELFKNNDTKKTKKQIKCKKA